MTGTRHPAVTTMVAAAMTTAADATTTEAAGMTTEGGEMTIEVEGMTIEAGGDTMIAGQTVGGMKRMIVGGMIVMRPHLHVPAGRARRRSCLS